MVRPEPFRVVFFGTPAFAVPTLEALLESRHTVVGVITQPDRPKGRGQRTTSGPVKDRALAANLPVLQPATLKDPGVLDAINRLGADVGVVAAYGKILSERLINTPRLGMINVHASLLPKYRGAAPVHRAVIAGERETGVTIMRVVRALDAGPMLATVTCQIGEDETSETVERELAVAGASLLVTTLNRMAEGPVSEAPQDDAGATYAHRLTKEDGLVDWTRSARDVHNLIRGLHPWPHAFTYSDGARIILLASQVVDGPLAAPGTVLEAQGDRLRVATGAGQIDILELQAEGRRPMRPREFLAGRPLRAGSVLKAAP
jgi:methionyl-tRNA formyltransferase